MRPFVLEALVSDAFASNDGDAIFSTVRDTHTHTLTVKLIEIFAMQLYLAQMSSTINSCVNDLTKQ